MLTSDHLGYRKYEEAVKWYRRAAQKGYVEAKFQLGFMYANARGVEKDFGEASKWYTKAAQKDHSQAQLNLGFMYEKGRGVSKSFYQAAKWYRKAARRGHGEAQLFLAVMYTKGRGVPKDYVLAYMWSNLAAAKGVKGAGKNRDRVEKKMTQVQIATAQQLTREWKPDGMGAELGRPILGAHRG